MIKIDYWEIVKGTLVILWKLWPLWVLVLAAVAIRLFFDWLDLEIDHWHIRRRFKKGEAWQSDRDLLYWLRGMEPSEFENYIADLFSRLGYRTQAVGQSHDGGIDVVAEKDGVTNYIQCKKFITSEVTVGAVRDFFGALVGHRPNGKGYFITTNKFTLEAEKFAEDKPIELVDGYKLIRYINLAKKGKDKPGGTPNPADHLCPRCGGTLVQRTGKLGVFYGCSNYPKCEYTAKSE
jgi:hypothetical protein